VKQLYSYQEIGTLIDQGKQVRFTCSPQARVSAVQKQRESDTVTITLNLSIRDVCVGIVDYEYASIADVLEAFDIDEQAEIWEVLGGEAALLEGTRQ
jgi:hypothetical protein